MVIKSNTEYLVNGTFLTSVNLYIIIYFKSNSSFKIYKDISYHYIRERI